MSKAKINPQTGKAYRAKGGCDVTKMKWVFDQGSIFTEEVVESKGESGAFVKARISIAFNVIDAGLHIVNMHNAKLEEARLAKEASIPRCTGCGTTENLHEDYGSGGPYRCSSLDCVVF